MIKSLLFFTLSLIIICSSVRQSALFRKLLSNFAQYLQVRAFPGNTDFEYFKFSILRIFLGILLFFRSINIYYYLINDDFSTAVGPLSVVYIISTVLLTFGLFTQYNLLFLMFFMWQMGDQILGSSTLANDICAIFAALLFITGAGKHISLDAKIISKSNMSENFLLYTKGNISPDTIALAKFSALVSYWAICMYSLSMHLNESAWMTGVAGPLLLTNNFMSTWHLYFEWLFTSSELAIHLVRYSLWMMMFWYLVILPFTLLGGYLRKFVIIWGLLFFTVSHVILNLGSLAEIEFLFWAALFWSSAGISSNKRVTIFYDDKCNLCDNTIRTICFLDIFSRSNLKPVSENQASLSQLNIDIDSALTDLYGVDEKTGAIYIGYDFYVFLSKRILLLWPLVPFLYLGKLSGLGEFIYRKIASRRIEIFGVCTIPTNKASYKTNFSKVKNSILQQSLTVHIVFLAICYILSIPAPYLGINGSDNVASRSAHLYGIAPINVFNRTDLRMAENWFTLTSLDFNELAPIFKANGERLEMHKSDRVYFGNTVRFRRKEILNSGCAFDRRKDSLIYLSKVYLTRKNVVDGIYKFTYTQYHQALPDSNELIRGKYLKNQTEKRCELQYNVKFKTRTTKVL